MKQVPFSLVGLGLILSLMGSASPQTPAPASVPSATAPATTSPSAATPANPTPQESPAPARDAAPAVTPAKAEPTPRPLSSPLAEGSRYSEAVLAAIGPQKEGKARVVFFRPGNMFGMKVGFTVREKDAELGELRNGRFFVAYVEPGKHTYTVHLEGADSTIVELEVGETYFIIGNLSMGNLRARPHLATAAPATFEAALPKLKLAEPLK